LAALLVVLVAAGTGCTPSTLPMGARLTADGQVEAFFRSCNETTLAVTLRATDQPMPPPSMPFSTGTTVAIDWGAADTAWEGTVPGDQTSILIPVVLRPDRTYQLSLRAAAAGDRNTLSSGPYLFVAADLTTEGVTSSGYRGEVPVSPEQFDERTESTCYNNGLGPYRWLLLAIGGVACTILGGLAFAAYQVGRAIGRPKPPPPPPWATPEPVARRSR
jgi:hypothetical protein